MKIRDFVSSLFRSRRRGRLDSAITVYKRELEAMNSSGNLSNAASDAINKAIGLLGLAEEAAQKGDIDKGWKCFHGGQRMELFALDSDKGLQARIKVLREEANKLRAWRRDAIHELLGTSKHPIDVTDHYTVYTAALLRDEHYSNQAYKGSLSRDYSMGLVVILLAALGAIFYMIKNQTIQFSTPLDLDSLKVFYSVAMFGLFGAIVSAIIKQIDMSRGSSTIPEAVTTWRVTGLRIFGGAAFALVLFLFLKTKIIDSVFSNDIVSFLKDPTPYTVYVISFCAGFTERFVLRAVSAVAGKKEG